MKGSPRSNGHRLRTARAGSPMRRLRFAAVVTVAILTLVLPSGSLAVHDLGLFELDTTAPQFANTADNSGPGAPYDWESLFDSNGNQILTSAAEPRLLIADFIPDYVTPDVSYFATSNKDIDDVNTWQCGAINNPTPKDEIVNAYAALFRDTASNHVILYAGAERDENNGNSFMGFWIFKDNVTCSSPGTFSGQHSEGDVLILSNFTGGGVHPLVEVYQWTAGALALVASGTFCHASAPADSVCGEVNGAAFQTTWAPHDNTANPLDANEFLEIGVDLTSVLNFTANSVPCSARFLAETRSSQELTATLKDFAGGQFNNCTSSTVTAPMAGGNSVSGSNVIPGTAVTDRAVVTGSALLGTAPGATGTVSFFLCGPQATQAAAKCTAGGTPVGAAVNLPAGTANPKIVDSSAIAPTAPGWYCFRADYSGDANYPASSDSSLNECFQVVKVTPVVTTSIHNTVHGIVTAVEASSTVHDFVSVVGSAGTPSGSVTLDWFMNGTCSGAPATTSAPLALNASGQLDATSFPRGPLGAGMFGFRAHYAGNTIYVAGDGPCEPLQVVDANISISPATAINRISTNHTLTAHVNVNTGSGGFVNAPNGTVITFTLSGAGSFVGPSTCTTAGGTGSCTVTISSATPGSSTVRAKTDVVVGGVTLHRESGDGKSGDSGDAAKLWADATARTDILNASGGVVTTVVSGTIVHDKVFVDRAVGTPAAVPNPTGSVIFHRYATIDCSGTATNQTVALTPGAPSTAVSDDFAPTANMSYQAEYSGDANYPPRLGACEPLTVSPVPAPAIAIVKNPKSQTVAVGGTATFTIRVTNAGNTVLTDVTVTDPLSPNCNRTKAELPALASMAPGASVAYTCTRPNVRATFDNVATATGTPPSGPNVTASDTAPVKAAPLQPVKKKAKAKKKKNKKPKVVSHKKPKATG
jgi:uncharacterized repeat protein (TIGR01451 family)